MATTDRTHQINVVLPQDVHAALHDYVARTGFSITHTVARAIRRDLARPPEIEPDPELPDAPPEPAPKPGRGRKPGKKKS